MTRLLVGLVLLCACERERPPPLPPFDAGPRTDAGRMDGGPIVRRDGGPIGPTIDGVIDEDEWEGASIAVSETETDRDGSTLTRMRAQIAGGRLFVAIEGSLAEGDALVLFADNALGGGGASFVELEDDEGALDRRLAQPGLSGPSNFRPDFAFGTTITPRTAVGLDDAIGWRDLEDPQAFGAIPGEEAPAVCTPTICETSIALDTLGGEGPRTIALFARIVGDGGFTNQTLPADDPLAPDTIMELLSIDDGDPPDAGVDGGVIDGGGTSIVIDGVVGDAEWAGAFEVTSGTVAIAPFEGNTLRSLRAFIDGVSLYVALEGTLTSGNALLVYFDADVGGPNGALVPFDDFSGMLDRALTKSIATTALHIDVAWGTLDMSRTMSGTDDRMGFRDVGTDPSLFSPLAGASACSADTCELRIALSTLGAAPGESIGVFARLGAATSDTLSNQTLPMDASAEAVEMFVQLTP